MPIERRLAEIRSRKREINQQLKSGTIKNPELRSVEVELNSLNDEMIELEEKRSICNGINNGSIQARKLNTPFNTRGGDYSMNIIDDPKSTPEYRSAFLAAMMGKATPEQRALTTTSSGNSVIPTTTYNQIMDNIKKQPGLISQVRILNVPGKLSVPQSQITDPATWHVEGADIQDSNKDPNNVTLTGYELAKLFSMSIATQAMSIPEFESYLINELTYGMSIALDQAIVNGSGDEQPKGLLTCTWDASNSINYSTDISYDDIANSLGMIPSNFRQNAAFVMNSSMLYKHVAQVKTSTGKPIFVSDPTSGLPLTLLSKRIVIDDLMPDDTVLLGDLSYYFLNFSQPMSILRSYEAGFTKGSIVYRAMAVVDGASVAPAFTKISKAA